jgi:hypothetical protein
MLFLIVPLVAVACGFALMRPKPAAVVLQTADELEEIARKQRALAKAKQFGICQDDLRNLHLR